MTDERTKPKAPRCLLLETADLRKHLKLDAKPPNLRLTCIAASEANLALGSASGSILLYSRLSSNAEKASPLQFLAIGDAALTRLAFSLDQKYLAVGDAFGVVTIFDVEIGSAEILCTSSASSSVGGVSSIAWIGQRRLVTGHLDGAVLTHQISISTPSSLLSRFTAVASTSPNCHSLASECIGKSESPVLQLSFYPDNSTLVAVSPVEIGLVDLSPKNQPTKRIDWSAYPSSRSNFTGTSFFRFAQGQLSVLASTDDNRIQESNLKGVVFRSHRLQDAADNVDICSTLEEQSSLSSSSSTTTTTTSASSSHGRLIRVEREKGCLVTWRGPRLSLIDVLGDEDQDETGEKNDESGGGRMRRCEFEPMNADILDVCCTSSDLFVLLSPSASSRLIRKLRVVPSSQCLLEQVIGAGPSGSTSESSSSSRGGHLQAVVAVAARLLSRFHFSPPPPPSQHLDDEQEEEKDTWTARILTQESDQSEEMKTLARWIRSGRGNKEENGKDGSGGGDNNLDAMRPGSSGGDGRMKGEVKRMKKTSSNNENNNHVPVVTIAARNRRTTSAKSLDTSMVRKQQQQQNDIYRITPADLVVEDEDDAIVDRIDGEEADPEDESTSTEAETENVLPIDSFRLRTLSTSPLRERSLSAPGRDRHHQDQDQDSDEAALLAKAKLYLRRLNEEEPAGRDALLTLLSLDGGPPPPPPRALRFHRAMTVANASQCLADVLQHQHQQPARRQHAHNANVVVAKLLRPVRNLKDERRLYRPVADQQKQPSWSDVEQRLRELVINHRPPPPLPPERRPSQNEERNRRGSAEEAAGDRCGYCGLHRSWLSCLLLSAAFGGARVSLSRPEAQQGTVGIGRQVPSNEEDWRRVLRARLLPRKFATTAAPCSDCTSSLLNAARHIIERGRRFSHLTLDEEEKPPMVAAKPKPPASPTGRLRERMLALNGPLWRAILGHRPGKTEPASIGTNGDDSRRPSALTTPATSGGGSGGGDDDKSALLGHLEDQHHLEWVNSLPADVVLCAAHSLLGSSGLLSILSCDSALASSLDRRMWTVVTCLRAAECFSFSPKTISSPELAEIVHRLSPDVRLATVEAKTPAGGGGAPSSPSSIPVSLLGGCALCTTTLRNNNLNATAAPSAGFLIFAGCGHVVHADCASAAAANQNQQQLQACVACREMQQQQQQQQAHQFQMRRRATIGQQQQQQQQQMTRTPVLGSRMAPPLSPNPRQMRISAASAPNSPMISAAHPPSSSAARLIRPSYIARPAPGATSHHSQRPT